LSMWHDIIHIMRWMKPCWIIPIVKLGSSLVACILSFHWIHGTYVLAYVQINLTHFNPYSCWPVILIIYNLPSWMCIKLEFMFLSMIIHCLYNRGKNIYICCLFHWYSNCRHKVFFNDNKIFYWLFPIS